MYRVAVIGAGSIGKRHIESILKSDMINQIYVIDSDPKTVDAVREKDKTKIMGGVDYNILPDQIDTAIIATSSAVRRDAFEKLISYANVETVIFEKVLFQRKEDYAEVEKILQTHNIKAWVNCARREYDSYREIKNVLDKANHFTVSIYGGGWGLGCNGIHMLDLIAYLAGGGNLKIEKANLLPVLDESKRIGYKEFYGSIMGHCGKCSGFMISCFRDSTLPMVMEFAGEHFCCSIIESKQKMYFMREENDWHREENDFFVPFQSQLTQKVVENILLTGDCNLTEYKESMRLHLSFMEPLYPFFEHYGIEKDICPIT